jgi:hypothetical protein
MAYPELRLSSAAWQHYRFHQVCWDIKPKK